MTRKKLKVTKEKVIQVRVTDKEYKKVKKYSNKHNNGVIAKTGRDAIINHIKE